MASIYHITVHGHLDQEWSDWFDGLSIINTAGGAAILAGALNDQAALYGVLIRIRDLGLPLLAVQLVGVGTISSRASESGSLEKAPPP